jgi:hypothetical protein
MTSDHEKEQPKDLAARMFAKSSFTISWMAFLGILVTFVSWPIRNIALVCWVYGSHAYFHDGIHVLPGKPVKFSNGVEAPTLPDLVTGFGAFIITVFGLTMLLIFALRFYGRHFARTDDHVA